LQLDEKLVQTMYGEDVGNSIGIIVQIVVGWKVGSNNGEDVGNSVSPISIIVEIADEKKLVQTIVKMLAIL